MSSQCYSHLSGDESFHSEPEDLSKIDSDDVSYRLRLLVNNNYFLPPAHSKPRPSDFPPPPVPTKKNSAPTFLDIFKVGKSKSKPTTPISGNFDALTPALRTTSDATVVPGFSASKSSSMPNSPVPELSVGRVVVVREKMVDLASAAKQAEDEVNASRAARRDGSQRDNHQIIFDDFIDPTDVVDVPLPSSRYPFAIQTSNVHGLGVQESVGAALLADRLPPSSTPDPLSGPEGDWRKALLKAAVGHSFDNLANAAEQSMSSPLPKPGSPSTFRTDTPTSRIIDKRIISNPILESTQESTSSSPPSKPDIPRDVSPNHSRDSDSQPSSFFLRRAETPAAPLTPLVPPPRKQMPNPLYSLSQTDLTDLTGPIASPTTSLRPMSTVLDSEFRHTMTPPPAAPFAVANTSTSSDALTPEPMIYSSADDHEGDLPRPSTSMSASDTDSYPSPTASAFHDALTGLTPIQSPTESVQPEAEINVPTSSRSSVDGRPHSALSAVRPDPLALKRGITSSPPPRVSSSLARPSLLEPLTAPPRTTSLFYGSLTNPVNPSSSTSTTPNRVGIYRGDVNAKEPQDRAEDFSTPKLQPISTAGHSPSIKNLTLDIRAPDPITPPLPVLSVSASSPSPSSPYFSSDVHADDSPRLNSNNTTVARSTGSRPLSLSQRRGNPGLANLTITTTAIPAIRSAPAVGGPAFPDVDGRHRPGSGVDSGVSREPRGLGIGLQVGMAPHSPVSFFDSIQSQPNAIDDLESSEDDDDDSEITSDSSLSLSMGGGGRRDLEDAHSFSQFSAPPLSPVHPGYASSVRSASAYHENAHPPIPMYGAGRSVAPSGSNVFNTASRLMRLGNHSTPYISPSSSINSNLQLPSSPSITPSRSMYSSTNSPLRSHPYASSHSNNSYSLLPPPSPTQSHLSFKERSLDDPDFRPKEHLVKTQPQPEFLKDKAKGKGLKGVGVGLGFKGRSRAKSIGQPGSGVEGGKKEKGKGKEPALPPSASFEMRPTQLKNRGLHGSASFEYSRSTSSLGTGHLGHGHGYGYGRGSGVEGKRRPATTETSTPSSSTNPSAVVSPVGSPLVSPTWAPSFAQQEQTQSFSGLGAGPNGDGRMAGLQTSALAKVKSEARERDQENMRKLDGLLIQHMEAEKSRMKKIAESLGSSSSGRP
ncbi:hypothetical protein K435DRAFT_299063 [Dendrothele bispora CBS 962.96]|uniref:Uncharacterized protein n=1 Tax=Dendrothele bispora (strain CBS 962.96) TaxID=1314807 RepID=A0A4S8MK66_DENBC|nr:hypothetical protein K435DRAFT_299063 [Dendrothele bispora CBS 962.96]